MFLKLVYDHRFFSFLSQLGIATKAQARLFRFIAAILKIPVFSIPLIVIERIAAFILTLPVPVYSHIIYALVKSFNGYFGYYVRALYYSIKAGKWAGNIIIDEDAVFEHIGDYEFDEFCMIDKKVIIGSDRIKIGKGCHIAMGTMFSKGGEVILEDFASVSYGCILITATDSPTGGHRTSGPMVPNEQRNVIKDKIILKRDAWVTSNVVVMPGTIIGEGSIIPPNSVITKNTKDWKIRLIDLRKEYIERERIKFPDPEY
jgi:acetyltransferase-like isoleucine patch superfamily enzyme